MQKHGYKHMIGYGTGKIFWNYHPAAFWTLNEELQEWEIQMKTKTQEKTSQLVRSLTLL